MDFKEIINHINEYFICEIDWSNSNIMSNHFVVRTNIKNIQNACDWVKLFSSTSNTNWIVKQELINPQK